jgi:7,8-dihydropterin-6-yl-methyl-4-(beta-D-ribofuranosyl)aminobenzene 5'-phosphate synthase
MIKEQIEITLLAENVARGRGVGGEHGLAYWIETPAGIVMFDTGQGLVLERNAVILNKDLSEVRAVVLSHGHYDHVGGLEVVLGKSPQASIYLHPDALKRRYSGDSTGVVHSVDNSILYDGNLKQVAAKLVETHEPTEVLDGIWVTGEIPRQAKYEDTGGAFYLDADGHIEDQIWDDQALYFHSSEGVVLVLGCAHAGVVNTMLYVAKLTGGDRLHAVIGGMHLLNASPERLAHTYEVFKEMGVQLIAPCHCTGVKAVAGFQTIFPRQFVEAYAGKTFHFD